MKEILGFHLNGCPYCHNAFRAIEELQAENHNAMTMKDWVEKLNAFLQFNDKEILCNAGKISASVAKELAYKEYDKFKVKQDKLYKSDFDNFLNETRMIENGSDK